MPKSLAFRRQWITPVPLIPPLLYVLLLAGGVGLGLPAGVLVVSAGVLYGGYLGLAVVMAGESIGLVLNWQLCRGLLRPGIQRWLKRQQRGRRLRRLLQTPASLQLMLLLRLALIPMNLVNASCALSPTPWRPYALASLVLLPRFAVLVQAGAVGAEASRGNLSPLAIASHAIALSATATVLVILGRRLRQAIVHSDTKEQLEATAGASESCGVENHQS
ncbi:MAG: VTT domain-containing protein [Cyanobacteria bacterium]|nr:VTT domain-containing protein [Cyanobacteriota bacterium]